MSIPMFTGRPPTIDTEETLQNAYRTWNHPEETLQNAYRAWNHPEETLQNVYRAWNHPVSSYSYYPPTPFVHNHTHFIYRVLIPDILYDLDFIILASPDICQWSRYQRDLVANITLYSLLWGTIRDLMMAQCNGRNILS